MTAPIEVWWAALSRDTQDWLKAHNGDVVPAAMADEIGRAVGSSPADASAVGDNGPDGLYLDDDAVDWIEALANGETPPAG